MDISGNKKKNIIMKKIIKATVYLLLISSTFVVMDLSMAQTSMNDTTTINAEDSDKSSVLFEEVGSFLKKHAWTIVVLFLIGHFGAYIVNSKPSIGTYGCALFLAGIFLYIVYLVVVCIKNGQPYMHYVFSSIIPLVIGYFSGIGVGKMAGRHGV